jgi:glycosyltransferase involved in cell wall biosynthesis
LKVSIIIPCRNEEAYIEKCLQSIVETNYPKEKLEVFVVDGMSDDKTRSIIQDYAEKHHYIHLIDNKKQTTPFALNIGIQASVSDVKIILGAHATIDKDYIFHSVNILKNQPETACVGGVIENVYENNVSKVIGKAMSSVFGVGNATFRTGGVDGYVDTVAFGAYRSEVFDKIGYFDEDLVRNQDDEFNFRLIAHGYKIFLSNSIKSKYYVRASFKKLQKQYFQYGYWKVFVNQKHQTITTVRQLFPALFVLGVFLGFFVVLFFPLMKYFYFMMLGLYVLLASYFSFKKSEKNVDFFAVIFSFLILHFSYGLGYLKGIVDFYIMYKKPGEKTKTLSR